MSSNASVTRRPAGSHGSPCIGPGSHWTARTQRGPSKVCRVPPPPPASHFQRSETCAVSGACPQRRRHVHSRSTAEEQHEGLEAGARQPWPGSAQAAVQAAVGHTTGKSPDPSLTVTETTRRIFIGATTTKVAIGPLQGHLRHASAVAHSRDASGIAWRSGQPTPAFAF